MPKTTVLSKEMKAIYKVRKYFEIEKNAGKSVLSLKKPRERTAAALGVRLRIVDRVYLESLATGVHI